MKILNKKLLRDFKRLWAQAGAIALVAAVGVMTLLLGVGTYRALSETQQAYYERYNFADIFANITRAPNYKLKDILSIKGIVRADIRIVQSAVLNIPYMNDPASGLIQSIPDTGEAKLNRLFIKEGRLPDGKTSGEIVISQAFAMAHEFKIGDNISAIMGGVNRTLTITGIALSPEFIYSVRPGDIFPDDKRFGIIWMRYFDVAASFNLVGAFNSVSVKVEKGANKAAIIDELDKLLKPYGSSGAYDRSGQTSHAFLDSELSGLKAMSYVLPPIFLGVAAFLVNMTLARLVALEREQIGLLKAVGYGEWAIAWHYVKLSLLIASVGTLLGWGFGAWAARGMATIYAEFFKFPFLLFQDRPDVYAISGMAAIISAVLGSLQAVKSTINLSAAVAMAPPAPPTYKRFFLDKIGLTRHMPQWLTMAIRNLSRRPVRAILSVLGISLSTGLLIGGLFTQDSLEYMIDATYFRADRQQATIISARPLTPNGMQSIKQLPGVISAEPFRSVGVSISNGLHKKRSSLTGKPANADLSRVIDLELEPITLPKHGIALSTMLADILDVKVGDIVEIEILDGSDKIIHLPISQIIQQYMGLGAYMEIGALNRAMGEGTLSNGAHIRFDTLEKKRLFNKIKHTPAIAGIILQRKSLEMLRATIGESMGMSRVVYIALAVIIVFGVVYNSMRIQLSERARELASLRVLGFTKSEVSVILLSELAILTLFAIPLGWLMGYGMAVSMIAGFQTELFRMPLLIENSTYVFAALIVLIATIISAYFVQRRIANLDMIAVLKTRD